MESSGIVQVDTLDILVVDDIFHAGLSSNEEGILGRTLPTPMFRELLPQERLESANDNIYVDINKWPTVTLKGIHKYFITGLDEDERPRGAEKHKISGYHLFKDGYVKKVKVKVRVKADMSEIFIIKNSVTSTMKKDICTVVIHLC